MCMSACLLGLTTNVNFKRMNAYVRLSVLSLQPSERESGRLLPGCSINMTETRNMKTTKIEACTAPSHSCKLYYDRPASNFVLAQTDHAGLLARVATQAWPSLALKS